MKTNQDSGSRRYAIFSALCLLAATLTFSGCKNHMALNPKKPVATSAGKAIAIFTLRTENHVNTSFQPCVGAVRMEAGGREKVFIEPKLYRHGKNEYNEYLISVELPPGDCSLKKVEGWANCLPVIYASFRFPVGARFALGGGVTYLGHVTMTNRKRTGGEERAGSIFPLIDQAVSGFAGGTFDITVTDQSATDLPDFLSAYPALQGVPIAKSIMQR
ncbi:MAG: hypothetical protein NTV08_00600 [Verrucomicrobia bacterium]|nr:hypothetical protein [Verrucomicrobiota bacterium]